MSSPSYHRMKYKEWKANGLCVYCGAVALAGLSFCTTHCVTKTESARKCRLKLKHAIFDHYGNQCACCGENIFEFLTIDHINGGGHAHRKEHGVTGGFTFYSWLKQHGFPEGFQTLCWNCNAAKHFFGRCPHNK